YFPIPLAVLAAIGLVGVFSGAANTPIACTLMAMELFGAPIGVLAAIASFSSYAISGHHGIYSSQRIHIPKSKYASKTIDLLTFFCKKASIKK
ncbi:MAG: hypothetical protein KDD45_17265, partial [Bdellovibrionales bacterium]|nr:hypothetical protein [Bdellovibrionales bacterium]